MKRLFLCCLFLSSITVYHSQPASQLLIKNANYLDLSKGGFAQGNILVEDGIISSISNEEIARDDATVIDASGSYIIPGLIDAHIHLFQSGAIYTRPDAINLTKYKSYEEERRFLFNQAGDLLKRYLSCGITTVIDIGGPMTNYDIRQQYQNNPDYPNLYLTGPLVSTYQPPAFNIDDSPILKVTNSAEARILVQNQVPYNPDFIKIWGIALRNIPSDTLLSIMQATVDESRKNDLRVFVHATQLNTAKLAVKAGADVLVHSVADPQGSIDEEFVNMLRDSAVVYIPTLVVSDNYSRALSGNFIPTEEDFNISNPFILGELFDVNHLPEKEQFDRWQTIFERNKAQKKYDDSTNAINLSLLNQAGITIATGTDAGNIGTLHASSFYDEVAAMQRLGMSNIEILEASTISGAKALGKEQILGSIEEGKIADLVLLKKNPLENIDHLKTVSKVIKNGFLHQAEEILTITPEILAQQQLNAYNAGDIDAFLEPYSEDVEIYNFPDQLRSKGKAEMRKGYASFFENSPDLHCELVNRIVNGNTIIDHERITGIPNVDPFTAVAIYKIENDKIAKVFFVR